MDAGQVHAGRTQRDLEAPVLPYFAECPLVDVGDEVAVSVDVEDGALQVVLSDERLLPLALYPAFCRSADYGGHPALRQMAGDLNEDVALWKRLDVALGADGDVVEGVGFPVRDQGQDAVVQADEELAAEFHDPVDIVFGGVRVQGDEVDGAFGEMRNGGPQGEGRLVGVVGSDAVGDVDDSDARVPLDDGALEGSGV